MVNKCGQPRPILHARNCPEIQINRGANVHSRMVSKPGVGVEDCRANFLPPNMHRLFLFYTFCQILVLIMSAPLVIVHFFLFLKVLLRADNLTVYDRVLHSIG